MSTKKHGRAHIYVPASLGERAADLITGFVGSWAFVFIHAGWFVAWILLLRVEPFPYGLLTLLVSLEAIFLSTFVMMSQNRSGQKDHIRDDHEAEEVDLLYTLNTQQLEILTLLRDERAPASTPTPEAPPSAPPAPPAPSVPVAAHKPKAKAKPPVLAVPVPRRRRTLA